MQVELLSALHGNGKADEEKERELLTQVFLTINGIVLGLRNTG
jgi:phosphoenolpyruvate carboxylase